MSKKFKHLALCTGLTLSTFVVSMFPMNANASGNDSVAINETNFPDADFRNGVKVHDKNKDGILSYEELGEVKTLIIPREDEDSAMVEDFTGIEYFYNLEEFEATYQKLSTGKLDLSGNKKLTTVDVSLMDLATLILPETNTLTKLDCSDNKLTSLDVSQNPALTELDCYDNKLTSLDVSKNPALTELDCTGNQLTSLDVSHNPALTKLYCGYNQSITELDLSNNAALRNLSCEIDRISEVDLTGTDIYRPGESYTHASVYPQTGYEYVDITLDCQQIDNCLREPYVRIRKTHYGESTFGTNEYYHFWDCAYCGGGDSYYHYDKNRDQKCDDCSQKMPASDRLNYVNITLPMPGEAPNLKSTDGTEYEGIAMMWLYYTSEGQKMFMNEAMKKYQQEQNSEEAYEALIQNTFTTFTDGVEYLLHIKVVDPAKNLPLCFNGEVFESEADESELPFSLMYYVCGEHEHSYVNNVCTFSSCHCYQKLNAPVISSLQNSATGVTLKWNAVNDAKYYKILRKEGSGSFIDLTTVSTASYTDTSAVAGKTYTYKVVCVNAANKIDVISDTTVAGKSIVCVKQPTTTVATVANGVKISWTKSAGATGYIVYRKTASTSWARVDEISGDSTLTVTDTTAASGTTYYYTVKAYKTVGSTTYNSTYVSTKALAYQKQPTTTVANAATGVKITWTKSAGATGYIVYRKTASTSWARVTVISGDSTLTTTDTKAVSGTTYYYTVKAYKTVSSTTYNSTFASSKAIVYQKQPTTTVANAATGVKISWTKSAGATGYIVYRKTASTSWARVAVISGDSTLTTTDTTAASGTTYYYTVKAYKTVSGTTYNSTFASTAALMYLKQPTVTLANVTGGVKVTWTKSTGATSYRVYRKTSGGSWTTLTTLGSTATTYTDKTAKSGTTYYYTVKAITGSYASSFVTTKYIKKN